MYLTDGCWFLISCVIQHYAPVVGWGGGGTGVLLIMLIMLIMTLLKLWGGGGEQREQRKSKRERRCWHHKSPDGTDTSSVMWAGGQISPLPQTRPTSWNLHLNTTQQYGPHTTVWALYSPHLPLHKITYLPMILMSPCIIDFIEANALLGPVGGGGPGHALALKWHPAKQVPFN